MSKVGQPCERMGRTQIGAGEEEPEDTQHLPQQDDHSHFPSCISALILSALIFSDSICIQNQVVLSSEGVVRHTN